MILAATGHRPPKLGGYNIETEMKLVKLASEYLAEIKPSLVISGMALGWDQAMAQAAMGMNIPFDAYVPFKGQESVWPASSQNYYQELLKHARNIEVCSPGGYSGRAMQIRNRRMVDASDHLVALWDGSEGGTGNCIEYAILSGRDFDNLWDKYNGRQTL